jgi:hypothetical protein
VEAPAAQDIAGSLILILLALDKVMARISDREIGETLFPLMLRWKASN